MMFVRTSKMMSTALLLLLVMTTASMAQRIRVGINDRVTEANVLISPSEGKYSVKNEAGENIYDFRSDDVLSVQAVGDSLAVRGVYGLDRKVAGLGLTAAMAPATLLLKFTRDGKEQRYAGDMTVIAKGNRLILVNTMDLDAYVSRVVQSEVGTGAVEEYYKIQSIICRTYAMGNMGRHAEQGYDVCDHQHCQVFDGKKQLTETVVKAAAATSGIVMADTAHRPILAAFHANCGGQTANAQDVWTDARSYLVSVSDTFCLDQRSALWKDTLYVDGLKAFVGSDVDSLLVDGLTWTQPKRAAHWELGGQKFRTSELRREFKLRSTFFDMVIKEGMVHVSGRGFGHGVGLCQQGAMQMAKSGFTYGEILGHYFTGVALVNTSTLKK
jgi:stage II sporulation protein D